MSSRRINSFCIAALAVVGGFGAACSKEPKKKPSSPSPSSSPAPASSPSASSSPNVSLPQTPQTPTVSTLGPRLNLLFETGFGNRVDHLASTTGGSIWIARTEQSPPTLGNPHPILGAAPILKGRIERYSHSGVLEAGTDLGSTEALVAIDQMRVRSDGSVVVAWLARSRGPQAGLLLRLTVMDSTGKIMGEKRFEDILSVFAPDSLCPLPSEFARFPSDKAVDIAVTGNQTALLAFTCGGHTLHLLDENLNPLWAQEISPPGLMDPTNLVGFGVLSELHGQSLLAATDDGKIVLGASLDGLALEAFSDAYGVLLSLGGNSDVLVAQFDTWGRIVAANTLGLNRAASISKLLVSSDSVLVMGSTGRPNQPLGSGPSLAHLDVHLDVDLHLTSLSLGNLFPRWQRVMDIRNDDHLIDAALTPEGNLIIGAATGSITSPRGELVMPSRTLLLSLDGQGNELARKMLQGPEQGTLLSMVAATATTAAGKGALTISGFRMRSLPEDGQAAVHGNDSTGFVNTLPLSQLGL